MKHALLTAAILLLAGTAQAETRAVINTDYGAIRLSLDEQRAPKTVANFVRYAKSGFYNGTVFHRVIPGFMIQGGGLTQDLDEKPAEKAIANEAANGLSNLKGTIAMARTANPHSATSQFFINTADNTFLNYKKSTVAGYGYAVFGRVTAGMDVADKISQVQTTDYAHHQNVPVKPVIIRSITIE